MPTEPSTIPTDRKTARQIKAYLAEQEQQRNRWLHRQKTDRRNRTWKRSLVAASYAQGIRGIRKGGGALLPADGTFFYGPSPSGDEQRVEAMEEVVLKHVAQTSELPDKGTTLADYAAEAVSSTAAAHLADLALLASQGDTKALEAYAQIARSMIGALNELPKPWSRRLRRFASRCLNWPVLMGQNPLYSDDFKSILQDLAVGARLPFSSAAVDRLKGKPHKRVLKLAMELACRLDHWRTREPHAIVWYQPFRPPTNAERSASHLKPFSKITWTDWFELGWAIVLEENKGHPEANPELRPLGLYREKHSLLEAQQKTVTHKTRESNIRDGIKEKVQQAFEQLAKAAP